MISEENEIPGRYYTINEVNEENQYYVELKYNIKSVFNEVHGLNKGFSTQYLREHLITISRLLDIIDKEAIAAGGP